MLKKRSKLGLLVAVVVSLTIAIVPIFGEPRYFFLLAFPPPEQNAEAVPETSGSIHGVVLEQNGLPIQKLMIELRPIATTEEQLRNEFQIAFTNEHGEYTFRQVIPDKYRLSVHKHSAPEADHPFAGTYYPGVEDEEAAEAIEVGPSAMVELHPMRLRRIDTATIFVRVRFADGSSPAWSNLLPINQTFYRLPADTAGGVQDGRGELKLPMGFEYSVSATVQCDAGPRIEQHVSSAQKIDLKNGAAPSEMTFIIPGHACRLWTPN